MVLSTCNRTEIFYMHDRLLDSSLIKLLGTYQGVGLGEYTDYFDHYEGYSALLHLFRVGVGLDSQVLGDIQIFGQVKQAYQLSVDADMAGPYLHRLLHTLFFAHKRVSQETSFKDGAASVSYNTVKLVAQHASIDASILVIGAGQMGTHVCRHLAKRGYRRVSITNRTEEKAHAVANDCRYQQIPFHYHRKLLPTFDIVISTVSAHCPLYAGSDFAPSTTKAVIDLSSPRSVAPGGESTGIKLFNIDDISAMTQATLARRGAEVPKVEQIVSEAIEEFDSWVAETAFSPSIQKFKARLEELRQQSLAAYEKRTDPADYQVADEVSKALLQKIVRLPVLQLKSACQRGEADRLVNLLDELFRLEPTPYVEP